MESCNLPASQCPYPLSYVCFVHGYWNMTSDTYRSFPYYIDLSFVRKLRWVCWDTLLTFLRIMGQKEKSDTMSPTLSTFRIFSHFCQKHYLISFNMIFSPQLIFSDENVNKFWPAAYSFHFPYFKYVKI